MDREDYYSNLYLAHHGVLGQKWGIRRYQNKDGSLTEAGKKKYYSSGSVGYATRSMMNSPEGQRLIGVGTNKGYREDKKEIKGLYKEHKQKIKSENLTKDERNERLASLKEDYKKTKEEARVSAAQALYSHQSDEANKKIQTESFGKQMVKSVLLGGFGSLQYDRLTTNNNLQMNKGKAAAISLLADVGNKFLINIPSVGDYALRNANIESATWKKGNKKEA